MLTCRRIQRFSTNDEADHYHTPVIDTITLDENDRHRRRLVLTSDSGMEFLLELDHATLLRHDDLLELEDGSAIRVQAQAEPLYAVRGRDIHHLLQLTWHIGNRHLATEVLADHLKIRRDPVIKTMLEQLGASVQELDAPFNPQSGAYGDAHGSHSHSH